MTLPSDEIALLCALSAPAQRARARQLYDLGWSLSAIGEAFSPPRSRSTVRAWVQSPSPSSSHSAPMLPSPPLPSPSSPSSSPLSSAASSSSIGTAESSGLAALASSLSTSTSLPRRVQRPAFHPLYPTVSEDDVRRIQELAPLARRYRARANPDGAYALANEELTQLCCSYYDSGTSIRELAHWAGVTYKAMERRVRPTR